MKMVGPHRRPKPPVLRFSVVPFPFIFLNVSPFHFATYLLLYSTDDHTCTYLILPLGSLVGTRVFSWSLTFSLDYGDGLGSPEFRFIFVSVDPLNESSTLRLGLGSRLGKDQDKEPVALIMSFFSRSLVSYLRR